MVDYRAKNNAYSLDDLPGLKAGRRTRGEWLWTGDARAYLTRLWNQMDAIVIGFVFAFLFIDVLFLFNIRINGVFADWRWWWCQSVRHQNCYCESAISFEDITHWFVVFENITFKLDSMEEWKRICLRCVAVQRPFFVIEVVYLCKITTPFYPSLSITVLPVWVLYRPFSLSLLVGIECLCFGLEFIELNSAQVNSLPFNTYLQHGVIFAGSFIHLSFS